MLFSFLPAFTLSDDSVLETELKYSFCRFSIKQYSHSPFHLLARRCLFRDLFTPQPCCVLVVLVGQTSGWAESALIKKKQRSEDTLFRVVWIEDKQAEVD